MARYRYVHGGSERSFSGQYGLIHFEAIVNEDPGAKGCQQLVA